MANIFFNNFFVVPVNDDNIPGVEHGLHGMAVHPAGDQIGAFACGANMEKDIIFNAFRGNERLSSI
jgi:hypothetical protein